MPYPVTIDVQPAITQRDRLTTFFRLILAIPHLILVGGGSNGGGLLSAAAAFLAIVSWFTILIAGTHIVGIRQFTLFYLRWRVRALAYFMLLRDEYPPFGDAPYPASVAVVEPAEPRDRLSVALRLILAIPHFIVLWFLVCAWLIATIVAWFAILLTGAYPQGLYEFGVAVFRWFVRVEAYMLLLVDEYPPFSLD
jgi:uncharacterized protein DUF4389